MESKHENKEDFSFWTKHKRFAVNEIMLYSVMVIGIILGFILVTVLF